MELARTYDRLFIGGDWVTSAGKKRIEVVSPSTEQVIGHVPDASFEDVDRAVQSARAAFDLGSWPRAELAERVEVIKKVRALLYDQREEFAQLITQEMGSPISQSRSIQVATPIAMLDAYIDAAETFQFRELRDSGNARALITREPVGVVAAVVPWNVPLVAAVQKLAPALLTGCTVIFKPAPETPLTTLAFARLLDEAGLPFGVLSVLPAGREVSEYLVGHAGVDKVTFTGSTAAGRKIASLCGQNLTRLTLELGGKSAAIVLDDADLDSMVESLRFASFRNSGQICSLKTRLVVPATLHDDVMERLGALVSSMAVGDPFDASTQIGPMVSQRQQQVVNGYIELGASEGAIPTYGGTRSEFDRGWFVEPTVFTRVRPDMRIAQEEIFGPVLSVLTYNEIDEAVALANDSAYGLNGAVYSADVDRALAVASRVRTGAIEINGNPVGLQAPVGGFKSSGIGREAGHEGLASYTETKSHGLPIPLSSQVEG